MPKNSSDKLYSKNQKGGKEDKGDYNTESDCLGRQAHFNIRIFYFADKGGAKLYDPPVQGCAESQQRAFAKADHHSARHPHQPICVEDKSRMPSQPFSQQPES